VFHIECWLVLATKIYGNLQTTTLLGLYEEHQCITVTLNINLDIKITHHNTKTVEILSAKASQ